MSDKVITLEIPEELAHNAEQLGLLSRDHIIAWLQTEIEQRATRTTVPLPEPTDPIQMSEEDLEVVRRARLLLPQLPRPEDIVDIDDGIKPTRKELAAAIRESVKRVASGKYPLRKLGLNKGTIWVSDDFDDPLPDSFWFGEEST